MTKAQHFRALVCLLGWLVAWPAAAQPAGQWAVDVGNAQSVSVTLRSLPSTSNPAVTELWVQDVNPAAADLRTQTLLDMRGDLTGKRWRGTWHWYGNSARPSVAVDCRHPHTPAGRSASHATTVWGEFDVTFNFDLSRFSGTWYPHCGVRRMRAAGVPVSGVRGQSRDSVRTTVYTDGVRDAPPSDSYLPIRLGRYRTTWGDAIVVQGEQPDELLIMFGGYHNVNYTISAGDWTGAGAGPGPRPQVRGRYFLALYNDVTNWDPPDNAPPRCATRFLIGNRYRWDVGALNSPRWGGVGLDFSRSGDSFRAFFEPCRDFGPGADTSRWPENQRILGTYVGPYDRSGDGSTVIRRERMASGTLPARGGPCHSITSLSVAALEPCRVAPTVRLQIRLTKRVPADVRRIYLKPLVDDHDAIDAAMRAGRPWPAHPTTVEIAETIAPGVLARAGDSYSFKLPATACTRDYWEVVIEDGTGRLHPHNGVVSLECGPGTPMPGW